MIPHERLLSIDERFANAAAKPVIIPETINCDRGRVYLSETFVRACASLGISVQPARPYTGSDKSLVERTFASINTLFCQHVAGYAAGTRPAALRKMACTACGVSGSGTSSARNPRTVSLLKCTECIFVVTLRFVHRNCTIRAVSAGLCPNTAASSSSWTSPTSHPEEIRRNVSAR